MLRIPMIVINFKTYESAIGQKAVELAKKCETVAKETGVEIAVAVTAPDIYRVSQAVSIPVLAEHTDPNGFGSHTGTIVPEDIKEAGAIGTILNHAERQIPKEIIKETVLRCKELGLMTIVCAKDAENSAELSELSPDAIAMEPPELIGGDISVTTADPTSITDTIREVNHLGKCGIVLVGAGVKNGEDIRKSIELGAKGVLLASGVTKAADPEAVLRDLAGGLKPQLQVQTPN